MDQTLWVHSQLYLAKADSRWKGRFESASVSSFRKDNADNPLMSKDYRLQFTESELTKKNNQKCVFSWQDSERALPAIEREGRSASAMAAMAWRAFF